MQADQGCYGIPVGQESSVIALNTGNGYGSTGYLKVRRFSLISVYKGTAMTYVDGVNGGEIHINVAGIYAISYTDSFGAGENFGLTVNATPGVETNTAIQSITDLTHVLAVGKEGTSGPPMVIFKDLAVGDIVRAQAGTTPSSDTTALNTLFITKIA